MDPRLRGGDVKWIAASLALLAMTPSAYAAGLNADEVRQVQYYAQGMRQVCSNLQGAVPTEDCLEEKALKENPALAKREGQKLVLKLAKGEKAYTDSKTDAGGTLYRLAGYYAALDAFLVTHQFYEGAQDVLVDRKTGKELVLLGSAFHGSTLRFSPDGARMVDYQVSEAEYTPNGLRVYDYDKEKFFTLAHDGFKPCVDPRQLPKTEVKQLWLYDLDAYWDKDNQLVVQPTYSFTQTCEMPRH